MSASGAGSQRALASSSSSVTSVTNTIDDTDAYWSDVAVHEHDQSQTDTAVQTDAGAFREIDYADLRFLSTTPLGRGAFGIVFAAEWRGVKVAVKKLMAIVDLDAAAADVQSECALMMRCNHHPNIVKFIGAARDGGTLCIVTQFCAHGSVFDAFVVRREPFSAAESVRILHDAALGVSHLHKESVIHRDIAARNVLLDEHNHVFVTDFGLARIKVAGLQSTKSMLGPVKYMAPEAIAKRRFSEASDAFSFGVLVWEVTHRQELYIGMEMFDVAVGVVAGTLRPTIESTIAPRLNALMQSCWKSAPHDRPTFSEIIAQLGV
jgi:serine/threonine protein kinase